MTALRPRTMAFVVGSFMGLVHFGWSVLVGLGWAQPALDFIFRLHMIEPAYHVMGFQMQSAVGLVVVSAAIGYATGWIFAALWNACGRRP